MNLEDAIEHAEQQAGHGITNCQREHRQLAGWLKELTNLRESAGLGGGVKITLDVIEQKMWEMFELGKKDYRGAAKETVEETRRILIYGGLPPNA